MTPEGYPDDQELETIRTWDFGDMHACMEYVRRRWHWNDMFRSTDIDNEFSERVTLYTLVTGGWSGNEDLVEALLQNIAGRHHYSRWTRGGKHEFEIPIKS